MTYGLFDFLGTIGVLLVVGAYVALQTGRLQPRVPAYSLFNALGAALILLSLIHDFNWSAFLIEAFWLVISLYGLRYSLKERSRQSAT